MFFSDRNTTPILECETTLPRCIECVLNSTRLGSNYLLRFLPHRDNKYPESIKRDFREFTQIDDLLECCGYNPDELNANELLNVINYFYRIRRTFDEKQDSYIKFIRPKNY